MASWGHDLTVGVSCDLDLVLCWVGGGEAGLEGHAPGNLYLCDTLTSPGAEHAEVGDAFVSFAIFIFFSSGCFPKKRTL